MSVIPVFVSSTFRDFHRERDELNRTVLPVLNELAAPFGSRVELIDLRWGITAEDGDARSRDLRILDVCLSEITRAEPLFVGLLGERYGWVAPLERMQRAAYEAGMSTVPADSSVTALEFEFGALRARSQTALFFEREVTGEVPEGWRDADLSKVAGLKERVHDLCTVHRYQVDITASSIDLSHFVATVAEHLGAQVRARARQLSATTVDPVSAATKLFFDDRSHGFAGRTALVEEVTDIADGGGSVCLSGASGSGKSAVWCAAVSRLRSRGHRVIAIPAAVAPEVATLHGILLRICGELGSTPDVSISPDELVQHAGELLGAAAPIIVAIDALDQLPDDTRLTFFTAPPSGVRILTSTTLDDHVNHLSGVGIQRVAVPSMDAEATRAAVTAISTSIRRTLPPEAVDSLASREPVTVEAIDRERAPAREVDAPVRADELHPVEPARARIRFIEGPHGIDGPLACGVVDLESRHPSFFAGQIDQLRMLGINAVSIIRVRLQRHELTHETAVGVPFGHAIRPRHFHHDEAVLAVFGGPRREFLRGHEGFPVVAARLLRLEPAERVRDLPGRIKLKDLVRRWVAEVNASVAVDLHVERMNRRRHVEDLLPRARQAIADASADDDRRVPDPLHRIEHLAAHGERLRSRERDFREHRAIVAIVHGYGVDELGRALAVAVVTALAFDFIDFPPLRDINK